MVKFSKNPSIKKIILGFFCLAGVAVLARTTMAAINGVQARPQTDIANVRSLAAQNKHIAGKYRFTNSKFIKSAKDKNSVQTEIGDSGSVEFKPDLTVSKWDGEVSFKVKPDISSVATAKKRLTIDGEQFDYNADKKDYVFYDDSTASENGGFEFKIILNEKPTTNTFFEPIESNGVDFYPQLPLNEEPQRSGVTCTATECKNSTGHVVIYRPEDAVDSIAVYATGKSGDFTALGGMNYMAGKVAQIKRVKAIDAKGAWVYCKQTILNGIWTKTCPQDFLDNAAYPVVIDPTIGYTSLGVSTDSNDRGLFLASGQTSSGEWDGFVTSIQIAAWSNPETHTKLALYNNQYGKPTSLVAGSSTGEITVKRTSKPTQDSEWTSGSCLAPISANTYYWPAFDADSNNMYIAYDSTGAFSQYNVAYSAFPPENTSNPGSYSGASYSLYASYTETSPANCSWTGSVDSAWANVGNWTSCNGFWPASKDTAIIGDTANQPSITTAVTIAALTINSGTLTLNGGSLAVNGNITLAGGNLTANSYPISVAGFFADNSGSFNAGTGTVTFIDTTGIPWNITNAAGTLEFSNIRISHLTAPVITSSFSIAGTLTIDSAVVFSLSGGTITFTGSGGSIVNNGSLLKFWGLTIGSNSSFSSSGNFSVAQIFNINSDSVFVPGASDIISGDGTLTGLGTVKVTRTAATPDFSSQYTIGGKALANLTVEYAGSAAQTISAVDYGNLYVKAAGDNITDTFAAGTINVGGDMAIGNGSNTGMVATAAANDPDINVSGNVIINANSTFTGTDDPGKTLNINDNLTINGVFTAPSGDEADSFELGGNFTNNGIYNNSAGRLTLSGNGNQSLGGTTATTAFYQLFAATGNQHSNTVYLIPNSSGDATNIRSVYPGVDHWEAINDPVGSPDEFSKYVYDISSGQELLDLYNLPDQSQLGTITNVQVYARYSGYDGISAGRVDPAVKTHGAIYRAGYCPDQYNKTWTSCNKGWTNNPNTGNAWTWDEINNLQAGTYEDCTGNYATYITQVYVAVTYNTVVPSRAIYFADGHHYAIAANGDLNLTGVTSSLLSLTRSDTTGPWYLDVNSSNTAVSVSYANVSWSDASGGKQVQATDGTNVDGGNTVNWKFIDALPPTITITNPDKSAAQSKTITASPSDGILTMANTAGLTCNDTLFFITYASQTFTLESDNGTKVCYKNAGAGGTTYLMSDAIGGIDTTGPEMTGLTNDSASTKSKTWNWSSEVGATFRFVIDTNATSTVSGIYDSTKTATQPSGNGDYYLHVQAKDTAGNESTVTTVFALLDNLAPVITVSGADPVTVAQGSTYTDSGATATDNIDSSVAVTSGGSVNTAVLGDYTVTYNATDIAGNPAITATRLVYVTDQTAPTISAVTSTNEDGAYKAGETIHLEINFSKVVNATSSVSLSLNTTPERGCTFTVSNSATTSCDYVVQAGDNVVVLDVASIVGTITDAFGNSMTNFTPAVNLGLSKAIAIDTVAPTVSISSFPIVNNANQNTVTVSGACTENGLPVSLTIGSATATPTCSSGAWSTVVDLHGLVDGTLTANIFQTDIALNTGSNSLTSTKDTGDPEVAGLSNDSTPKKAKTWSWSYGEESATFRYAIDQIMTWTATGDFASTTIATLPSGNGTYYLHVQAQDGAGNASAVATVSTLLDNLAPVITVSGADPVTVAQGSTYTDSGATATDNIDSSVAVTSGGSVNTAVLGDYTVTYNATDIAGNPAITATRLVYVTDQTAPTISELSDDSTPRKTKIWTWNGETGDTFRFVVDRNATTTLEGEYGDVASATQAGGNGTYYLHVQSKDAANNESGVVTVFAILDNTAPTITVTDPNTDKAQSKILTAITSDGLLTMSINTGLVCDGSLIFISYTDHTFVSESDNGKRICYKAIDTAANAAYQISEAIGGIDVTPPSISELADDLARAKSKTWNWSGEAETTFRFAIDQNPSWTAIGEYVEVTTATQAGGNGTYYLHVQSKDAANNESGVVTVFAILDNTAPTISETTATTSRTASAISWNTDEAASSKVEYGLTDSYGEFTEETDITAGVAGHSVNLSGLDVCSTYHYRAISKDEAGNEAIGGDETFKTECGSLQKPSYSNQLQVSNQIQNIQQEISRLQSLLGMANSGSMLGNKYSCAVIVKNLYFGIANDPQVYCLQEFLTDQGAVIYPEARITGNFYQMTKAAVIRFQEKHQSDILTPFGLTQGNGFVGLKTRQAINQLIGN